jgi:hypothetical protein
LEGTGIEATAEGANEGVGVGYSVISEIERDDDEVGGGTGRKKISCEENGEERGI